MVAGSVSRLAEAFYPELIGIRRDIHRHPELSGEEERTAALIAYYLDELGLEVETGVGGHGVVAFLRGTRNQPVVAYRADMDALEGEIFEDHNFSSVIPNTSHKCGHDVHVAIALGAAHILTTMRSELPGSVKFIFQPAEENLSGAVKMLEAGVLDNNPPLAIFATHVAPCECGKIAVNPGLGLPGIEEFTIYFQGENAVQVAENIERSINQIGTVSYPKNDREAQQFFDHLVQHASEPDVFILAEGYLDEERTNGRATLRGFIKASSESEYVLARNEINSLLSDYQDASLVIHRTFDKVVPDMVNDEVLAMWSICPLQEMAGSGNVIVARRTTPFSGEDFACFLQRIPGVMFFLGGSNKGKNISAVPHSPHFAIDERAILVGVKCMANLLYRYLVGY
jgi:amidohydrolase